MMSLQCCVFQSPCFELKNSDNQKAYGLGCLADDTTDKMKKWPCHRYGPCSECKYSKFHDIPWRYTQSSRAQCLQEGNTPLWG